MEQRSCALPGPDPPIGDQAGNEGNHNHAGATVDHRGEGERDFSQESNHSHNSIQGKDDGEDQPVKDGGGDPVQDAYGPTMLACLEYIAHRWGIHPHLGNVWFSLGTGKPYEYEAVFYDHRYKIRSSGRKAEIMVDGKAIGTWNGGICLMTDERGSILRTAAIESEGDLQ